MRIVRSLALALLALGSLTGSYLTADSEMPQIDFSLTPDGRKWKVAFEEATPDASIKEYTLENENVDNWSELVTLHGFKNLNIDPTKYYDMFIQELKRSVPNDTVDSKVLASDDTSVLGEWWISGSSADDQHEWIRIFESGPDLAILRYTTKKNADLDTARKTWEGILKSAKVKAPEEAAPKSS